VPIPKEPVYGEADSGSAPYWSSKARVSAASGAGGAYKEASIERGTLTPVSASHEPQSAYVGGSYALQPLDPNDGGGTPSASKLTYESAKRYAGPAPTYYDNQPKNYRPREEGYEPRGRAYEDKPRGGYDRSGSGPDGEYVVAPGDTIFSIAQRHGMSTVELADLNRLNGSTIHPGQRLRVRGPEYTSANKYKAPSGYEPGSRDRGGNGYGSDDRKAPPSYTGDQGGRYSSYSDYNKSQPKPYYGRDEKAEGREQTRASGRPSAYADRPSYVEKRYDAEPPRLNGPYGEKPSHAGEQAYAEKPSYAGKQAYSKKPSQADERAYSEGPPHAGEQAYSEKRSHSDEPSYGEQRDEEKAPSYSERKPYAGKPRYEDRPQEREQNRHARADDRETDRADEPRYEPRRAKNKGSYSNYSVRPGDTIVDVARRNGLSDRELAEFNDIPPSARLYPGQVLRLPKGKGYGWGERGIEPKARLRHDEGEDQDDRPPQRRVRPGFDDRTSQKTPAGAEPALNERERGVAKASSPQEEREPPASDTNAGGRPEAERPSGGHSEPIMAAAHRDIGTPDAQPGGEKAGAQDCESLLANPASRSAQTFREPVQGVVTAKFGSKTDGSFNDGIEFSVPKGTPVKAAENGVVAYAGNELPGFGNLVLVRHADGFVTAYAHNDELLVRRCEVVKRGQIISKAGASGKTNQPQLHFELRKDSKPIDPEAFFARS
jgi:murein DD-endopeptidase MepM/ murein hydrolase activator NlpD